MNDILKTTANAFLYIAFCFFVCFGIVYSLFTGEIIKGFTIGLISGILVSIVLSLYFLVGLILFEKKMFFYSKMPKQLNDYGVMNIYFESVAGNASGAIVNNGALFLTNASIIYLPHRFDKKSLPIELSLRNIMVVNKAGINLFKPLSGGLRKRLLIKTNNGEHYEFTAWPLDTWIEKIQERIQRVE